VPLCLPQTNSGRKAKNPHVLRALRGRSDIPQHYGDASLRQIWTEDWTEQSQSGSAEPGIWSDGALLKMLCDGLQKGACRCPIDQAMVECHPNAGQPCVRTRRPEEKD
jgi:hypothetical protein